MRVLRILVEGIARLERLQLTTLHLHFDRAFQHVNEYVTRVTVCLVDMPGSEFNGDQHTVLARMVGQRLSHQRCDLHAGMFVVCVKTAWGEESDGKCRARDDACDSHRPLPHGNTGVISADEFPSRSFSIPPPSTAS